MNLKHDKPYAELRAMMRKYEISQAELGRLLKKSVVYVNTRITAKKDWTLSDMYIIQDFFGFADADLAKFFPREVTTK
ncbi:MAG: hypothetical protein IJA35_07185 [Clostridia bacterium]|nr:hypothetical protein [Clostridia bacterium]